MNKYLITLVAAAGLVAGCNKSDENVSQDFNTLPPAVQKTARAQSPNGEILGVSKTSENGVDAYKIEYRAADNSKPTVVIASDGRLISSDMPRNATAVDKILTPTGAIGTKFSSLPPAAQKTIQAQAPNAEIADVSRHDKDGRIIYEVEFRDKGKNPTIQVAEDGTLVQNLQK
jgi:uncharacterized membrane protein YkoI